MTDTTAIERAIRDVPGVLALYARTPGGPLVTTGDGAVAVSIGVTGAMDAPATAEAVAAAIRSTFPGASIAVRISRVA